MANSGAQAGILVFDGAEDAPLRGRHYMAYPDGEIVVVIDEDNGTLAFEVRLHSGVPLRREGCRRREDEHQVARSAVRQALKAQRAGEYDQAGSSAVRRGLDKVDGGYDELRQQALVLREEVKAKTFSRRRCGSVHN